MKIEPGKLYEATDDISFYPEDYCQIWRKGEIPPKIFIKKGTILLFIKNRIDQYREALIFLFKDKLITPFDDEEIGENPHEFFERAL